MNQYTKPIVAISMGDPNGIGPEIILKSLARRDIQGIATFVVFIPAKLWTFYKRVYNVKVISNQISSMNDIKRGKINVFSFNDENFNVQLGDSTTEGGKLSFESLQLATKAVQEGKCDLLVTAPINKANIQSEKFKFPGHTEYLESIWGGKNLMFMIHDTLKVGLVTQHIPVKEVSKSITEETIFEKLISMHQSLNIDFGYAQPKIAVLGLNPHAGDKGLIGDEESTVIIPTLQRGVKKNLKVFGPYPADSFFTTKTISKFDGVLAMYHDQGLTPFKTLAGLEGVNYTAGLSYVRTSPDHGVGYDIADKGIADETSMVEAIYFGVSIFEQRSSNLEMREGALQIKGKQRRR